MKKDLENKYTTQRDNRLLNLPDFIADYIFYFEDKLKLRSQIAQIKDLNVFLEYLLELPNFKDKSVKDIKTDDFKNLKEKDIRDFLRYLSSYKKTYTLKNGKTVHQNFSNSQLGKARKLATLHSFFKYLAKEKSVDDITSDIEISVDKKVTIKDYLSPEELKNFLETIVNDYNIESERHLKAHKRIKFRDYCMVLIMGYTGIRISELVQLDISDISVNKRSMIVIRKGGDQERIYIPAVIINTILEFISLRKNVTGIDNEYKDALFISEHKKRITDRTVRYALKKYKERSNIDIEITPHVLRRTFAMEFLNKGKGDIDILARLLGHSTVETTRKSYAKPTEERKQLIMDTFDFTDMDNDEIPKTFNIKDIELISSKTGIDMSDIMSILKIKK